MIIDIKGGNKEWGNAVRSRLITLDLSQKSLAEKTGIHKNRLCYCLRAKGYVSLNEVRLIENALMEWELEYAREKV